MCDHEGRRCFHGCECACMNCQYPQHRPARPRPTPTTSRDSIVRALIHHQATGALTGWSLAPGSSHWWAKPRHGDEVAFSTLRDAWLFCCGLAAAAQHANARREVG